MDDHWLVLINSDWHNHLGRGLEDRLDLPAWIRQFVTRWDFSGNAATSRQTRDSLRRLRSILKRIVKSIAARGTLSRQDLISLNAYIAREPVVRRLEMNDGSYRIQLVSVRRSRRSMLAQIVMSFAEVLVNGDLARIKICENDDCGWVFYDRSRNRTRRWCEDATCGNLVRVRRFRFRKRNRASDRQTRESSRKRESTAPDHDGVDD